MGTQIRNSGIANNSTVHFELQPLRRVVAPAIDLANAIPCDRCHELINASEFYAHTCSPAIPAGSVGGSASSSGGSSRADAFDGIPCEFCATLISFAEYEAHARKCGR